MKCPKCESESVVEKDCLDCEGYGVDIHDNLCAACDGDGDEKGIWRCLECSNEWEYELN